MSDIVRLHHAGEDASEEARYLVERESVFVRVALAEREPALRDYDCTIELPRISAYDDDPRIMLRYAKDGRGQRGISVPLSVLDAGTPEAARAFVADLERQLEDVIAQVKAIGQPEAAPTKAPRRTFGFLRRRSRA